MSKTISIHLPDGNPKGIKIIEISNRIIRAYEIPRILLAEIQGKQEVEKAALYILFDSTGDKVYVGKSSHFYGRIKIHERDEDKIFWDKAVAFFAKDSSLDPGDIDYLEYLAIKEAKNSNRTTIMNTAGRQSLNFHDFKKAQIEEYFDDVKLITSHLGYKMFDSIEHKQGDIIWHCKSKGTDAKGIYNEKGFTVLKGSIIDSSIRPSFLEFESIINNRNELLENKAEKITDQTYRLNEDIIFDSLNKASLFCVGGSVNGWFLWKDDTGKTIDEVIRKSL